MNIGEIIHSIRNERKLTLAELSSKSGVALATLSRIENDKMTGTLESHMQIASALGVSLPELYRNIAIPKKDVELQTKKDRTDVFLYSNRSTSEMLVSNVMNKKMMPLLMKISAGAVSHKEETKPDVEKFIYILDGNVEAYIGEEKHALTKGDTLYFESSLPHYFKNIGKTEAHLIIITTPPTL